MTTENLNLELKISLDEVFENPAEIDEKEFKDIRLSRTLGYFNDSKYICTSGQGK